MDNHINNIIKDNPSYHNETSEQIKSNDSNTKITDDNKGK